MRIAIRRPHPGLYRYWAGARDFGRRCRESGFFSVAGSYWHRARMENSVSRLPPLAHPKDAQPLEVHFLTGSAFWYQTVFCAYSLALTSRRPVRPFLYDDGTLASGQSQVFHRLFPLARIFAPDEIRATLDAQLPAGRFPYLRRVKLPYPYPHIGKLTDVHSRSPGWKLVLDSDMLFLHEPSFLIDWLDEPSRPLLMSDVRRAYGYSEKLLEELSGVPQQANINVGVCGLRSDAIDWDKLEFFCRNLVEKEGHHYFLEQALTALLVAGQEVSLCPPADYIVYPSGDRVRRAEGALHHYTGQSKIWYFRYGWRQIVQLARRT